MCATYLCALTAETLIQTGQDVISATLESKRRGIVFSSPVRAFKENRFPEVIMSSDRLSRAHEQKYWDGVMVRDFSGLFTMSRDLVSAPYLARVPPTVCSEAPRPH